MGLFFAISIIATIARITIRMRIQKRLLFDDWLLVVACVCRSAAVGLVYKSLDALYIGERLLFWEVSIQPRQKLLLVLTLSLSIFMIIVTVVRISGIRTAGSIDET